MSDVPCNGCTLCCRGRQLVVLVDDDDPSEYETVQVGSMTALKFKENGDCIYVTDEGCSIYGRAPKICRFFDCRQDFLRLSRKQRRVAVKKGLASAEVMARGRELSLGLLRPTPTAGGG